MSAGKSLKELAVSKSHTAKNQIQEVPQQTNWNLQAEAFVPGK